MPTEFETFAKYGDVVRNLDMYQRLISQIGAAGVGLQLRNDLPQDSRYQYRRKIDPLYIESPQIRLYRDMQLRTLWFEKRDSIDFTYTDHGDLLEKENIVTGQKISLTYDQRGQLKRAALSGGRVITYTIDGEGKRLSRSADGVLTAYYLHDFSGRLAAEVEIGGALRTHFIYASQSHSPDYMIRSGVRYYFAKDQLGSVRAVINVDTGTVAQAIHYDEFGSVLADTNPGFQPFGFAGGQYDHETGLVRFGARDYDAEVGRWTARDPVLFSGGDVNLYRYVASDPVNYIDPSGLSQEEVDCAVAWLRIHRSDLFEGVSPEIKILDKNLFRIPLLWQPMAMTLPHLIYVDTNAIGTSLDARTRQRRIVETVAHELMHA